MISTKLFRKTTAIVANFSLLLNSFIPYLMVAQPVLAQDITPTEIVENTPTPAPPTIIETPTSVPAAEPTIEPTSEPTLAPTSVPATEPTIEPTVEPTVLPTSIPVVEPTDTPTNIEVGSNTPTSEPSVTPQNTQSLPSVKQPDSTQNPSTPTAEPTISIAPTILPTATLTSTPTLTPTTIIETAQVDTIIVANNSCRTDLLNPLVSSDKADYSPTEIAIISGSNFVPNTQYSLVITSNDLNSTYAISTDSEGNFTYSYQLDGTYRPDYKVEVKANDLVVATTTFTDSAQQTSSDAKCVEDAANKSLQCTANDVTIADVNNITVLDDGCQSPDDTVTFKATWDVRAGANKRYDIGLYFATNGQSSAKSGLCSVSTLANQPSPWHDYDTDACGDINSNETLHPQITVTAKCIDENGDNKLDLPYCLSWDNNDNTSCSGPSQAIPGTGSKCNCQSGSQVPINVPSKATITVNKVLSPTNDSGKFNLQVDGSTTGTGSNVGNGGTTGAKTVFISSTHTISETANASTSMSDYTSTYACNNGLSGSGTTIPAFSLTKDQNLICTFTNTKKISNGTLKIIKHVVNDNGGGKNAADFTLKIGNTTFVGSESGTTFTVANGTYSVTESAVSGYSQTNTTCNDVTITAGDNKTCTITNDDQSGTLIVKKIIKNDNGGKLEAKDFSFKVNNGSSTLFELDGQNDISIGAGKYTVVENSTVGYSTTYQNCSDVEIVNGGTATCTITNDDIAPKLKVIKVIDNNGSGINRVPSDFQMKVDGSNVNQNESIFFSAGNHLVTESGPSGYAVSFSTDCPNGTVSLSLGDDKTCTVTNTAITPKLKIIKIVDNNNTGATYTASDFQMKVDGSPVSQNVSLIQAVGNHTVTEEGPAGYSVSYSESCSNGETYLALEDDKTCTVTNTAIAPKLTLVKEVDNNYGGIAGSNEFGLTIGGTLVASGETKTLMSNVAYSINEVGASGYNFDSIKGDSKCPAFLGDTVTLSPGDDVTCTITNKNIQPKLTIYKVVKNDNGGTSVISEFPLFVNTTSVISGQQNGFNAGTYQISETKKDGYLGKISGDCDGNGNIILHVGDVKTCTITNSDIAPKLKLLKTVISSHGGQKVASDWTLTAQGSTLGFSDAGDSSTFHTVKAGVTYNLSESGPYGYDSSWWTCDGGEASGNTVLLSVGDEVTCSITNTDQSASITLTKQVINDFGGKAQPNDFKLTIDGVGTSSGSTINVNSNKNIIINETQLTGYSLDSIVGDEKCPSVLGNTVNLSEGEHISCTIINKEIQPLLTISKVVVNNYGGTKTISDFPLYVGEKLVTSGIQNSFDDGTYVVSETSQPGYTSVISGDCDPETGSVTLNSGDIKSCTITNSDLPATLIVKKVIVDDNGGQATASDFKFTVNNGNYQTFNSEGQNNLTVPAGIYDVVEKPDSGYKTTYENCDKLILGNGETKTCTITNDDIAPELTVVKTVVNDNGGTKKIEDFTLYINSNSVISGVAKAVSAYSVQTVSEDNLPGYSATSWGGDCNAEGKVILLPGEKKTCTITNDDNYGQVIVAKFNDLNGNGVKDNNESNLSDWKIKLTGNGTQDTDESGIATFNQVIPGVYGLSEIQQKGWEQTNIYCVNDEPTSTPTPMSTNTPTPTPPEEVVNACHKEGQRYVSKKININAWSGHQGHGDFLYEGPYEMESENADRWCNQQLTNLINKIIRPVYAQSSDNDFQVNVKPTQIVRCYIGNKYIVPKLTISKSNNRWPNNITTGSDVEYTIHLNVQENNINNVTVVDLPPNGFKYKLGSYKVFVNGVERAISEPVYHSPGQWNLGNLNNGDVVTLSYLATIDSAIDSGLYKDAAYAYGFQNGGDKLLASAVDSGKTDTGILTGNFVGTKVAINPLISSSDVNIVKEETVGQVLGAYTEELPGTGSNPIWMLVFSLLFTSGFGSISYGLKSKKKN